MFVTDLLIGVPWKHRCCVSDATGLEGCHVTDRESEWARCFIPLGFKGVQFWIVFWSYGVRFEVTQRIRAMIARCYEMDG